MAMIEPRLVKESVHILCGTDHPTMRQEREVLAYFEDANSSITSKYLERLYMSVISKAHIDSIISRYLLVILRSTLATRI